MHVNVLYYTAVVCSYVGTFRFMDTHRLCILLHLYGTVEATYKERLYKGTAAYRGTL